MKLQIALIIISMLAAMPTSAQNVNQKENDLCAKDNFAPMCEENRPTYDFFFNDGCFNNNFFCPVPPVCDWENIIIPPSHDMCPDFEEGPAIPEKPDVDAPEVDKPEVPETPDTPDVPETPEIPEVPDVPDAPEVDTPDIPQTPVIPEGDNDTSTQMPENSQIAQVLQLVNAERQQRGIAPLTYDATLARGADIRAREIKSYFSHTRPNGTSCFTVFDEIGYDYMSAGENIAYGQQSASEVMTAWMNSEGHRANILNPDYTHIGIGLFTSDTLYWSQLFAK